MLKAKTIFLLFVLACNILAVAAMTIAFNANRTSIAESSCEFRKTEITMCYGSCVLRKEIKETLPDENSTFLSFQFDVNYLPADLVVPSHYIGETDITKIDYISPDYIFMSDKSFFHPPSA